MSKYGPKCHFYGQIRNTILWSARINSGFYGLQPEKVWETLLYDISTTKTQYMHKQGQLNLGAIQTMRDTLGVGVRLRVRDAGFAEVSRELLSCFQTLIL